MRFISLASAALCVLLWSSVEAQGQAGRYIPVPRVPSGGGSPHIPFFHGSDGGGIWVMAAIVGVIVLVVVGWNLGQAMGKGKAPEPPSASQSMPPPSVPPLEDLIIQPEEVAEKARLTTCLLEELAEQDAALNPHALREFIATTFTRVQQCWEARDYGLVRELLGPSILAQHEEMLRAMGRNREINRYRGLTLATARVRPPVVPGDGGVPGGHGTDHFRGQGLFCQRAQRCLSSRRAKGHPLSGVLGLPPPRRGLAPGDNRPQPRFGSLDGRQPRGLSRTVNCLPLSS